jgi:hypothetical protein
VGTKGARRWLRVALAIWSYLLVQEQCITSAVRNVALGVRIINLCVQAAFKLALHLCIRPLVRHGSGAPSAFGGFFHYQNLWQAGGEHDREKKEDVDIPHHGGLLLDHAEESGAGMVGGVTEAAAARHESGGIARSAAADLSMSLRASRYGIFPCRSALRAARRPSAERKVALAFSSQA